MTVKEKNLTRGNRIYWMDNLRTIIILFVVLYHVGGVYESAGLWGWFWIVFDLFMMPTIFFICCRLIRSNSEFTSSFWVPCSARRCYPLAGG